MSLDPCPSDAELARLAGLTTDKREQAKILGVSPSHVDRELKRAKYRQEAELRARAFRVLCRDHGVPMPERELRFAWESMRRKWQFDFAWEPEKIALECDGGLFTEGGHVRGRHIMDTHEKLNTAAVMGWRVLYCVPDTLNTLATINTVRTALQPVTP
jgi:hypothetical protein